MSPSLRTEQGNPGAGRVWGGSRWQRWVRRGLVGARRARGRGRGRGRRCAGILFRAAYF